MDSNELNRAVIEEFRANDGECGGQCEGADMVIITTTGARSGQRCENPLESLADGDRVVIFASNAGASRNPDWYHNLVANPMVTVERGTYDATATVLTGEERDRLYAKQASIFRASPTTRSRRRGRFRSLRSRESDGSGLRAGGQPAHPARAQTPKPISTSLRMQLSSPGGIFEAMRPPGRD